jgi:hypothetical protein
MQGVIIEGLEENKRAEIDKKIKSEFTSGQNVYISNLIDFAFSIFILFGEEGRVRFLHRIGLELDSANSLIVHRQAWAKLLREA